MTYAYDSLKRLIDAKAASQWELTFSYDGFGNRLSQNVMAGTAPTIQQSYDMSTNRLLGQSYDNNGNMTSMGTFDVENRLVSSGTDTYGSYVEVTVTYQFQMLSGLLGSSTQTLTRAVRMRVAPSLPG